MIEAEARALGLPTATVTFLLVTGERPANGEALLTHPDVASEVALSSFTDAGEALVAAFESQRGGDGRWAVHTGEVIEIAPTIGPTLDRGLALLAIGGSGQILVSASTAARVENRLPVGTRLVDRGIHRLHDLGRPEHVWQLSSDGLPAEAGDLRSLTTFRHNLPTQLTPLIGRRADIGEIGRLVSGGAARHDHWSRRSRQDAGRPRRRRRIDGAFPGRRVVGRARTGDDTRSLRRGLRWQC